MPWTLTLYLFMWYCVYCKYIFIAWLLVWLHQLSLCSESHDHSQAERSIQSSVIPAEGLVGTDLWGSVCEMVAGWPDAAGSLAWPESTGWPEVFTSCFTPLLRLHKPPQAAGVFLSLEGRRHGHVLPVRRNFSEQGSRCVRESRTLPICFHISTHVGSGDGCVANGFHWIFINGFWLKTKLFVTILRETF